MNKAPLSTIAEVIRGVSFSKDEGSAFQSEGRLPVIRAGSIQESLLLDEGQIWVPEEKVKDSQKIRRDDIVMCTSSGSSSLVGKCARADVDFDGSFGAFCAGIRPNKARVSASYLYHFLSSPAFRNWTSSSSGANIKNIRISELGGFEIPLPPLEEQKRIATILDKADAIRCKRQHAIQLADEFLRAVFLDMFGDPVTNPKRWEVKPVSECLAQEIILHVQDGNHGNDHPKVSEFTEEGIPFLTANVMRRGKILFDRCYYLGDEWLNRLRIGFAKPRDVVISHKGSLGFTAVLDDEFDDYILSPQTTYYRVDEDRLLPEYLKAYFDSNYFQRLFEKEGIQSTRAYLGITRQKDLPIMLPGIQKQHEYVAIANQFKGMMEKIISSSGDLKTCFDSLGQRAFSGKL